MRQPVRSSSRTCSLRAALVCAGVLPPHPCHTGAKASGKTMVELSCERAPPAVFSARLEDQLALMEMEMVLHGVAMRKVAPLACGSETGFCRIAS